MEVGDKCFFYHSNIGKEIVGIVEVIKTAFLDKTDKKKRLLLFRLGLWRNLNIQLVLKILKKTMKFVICP